MEIKKVEAYIESLKKLNDFMASIILQLNSEASQLESSLSESRKQYCQAAKGTAVH